MQSLEICRIEEYHPCLGCLEIVRKKNLQAQCASQVNSPDQQTLNLVKPGKNTRQHVYWCLLLGIDLNVSKPPKVSKKRQDETGSPAVGCFTAIRGRRVGWCTRCRLGMDGGHETRWAKGDFIEIVSTHMVVSIAMGVPNSWLVYQGKSQSTMDDDWGYPHLWKPPYVFIRAISARQWSPNMWIV